MKPGAVAKTNSRTKNNNAAWILDCIIMLSGYQTLYSLWTQIPNCPLFEKHKWVDSGSGFMPWQSQLLTDEWRFLSPFVKPWMNSFSFSSSLLSLLSFSILSPKWLVVVSVLECTHLLLLPDWGSHPLTYSERKQCQCFRDASILPALIDFDKTRLIANVLKQLHTPWRTGGGVARKTHQTCYF